jgi:hypothetical protein
MKEAQPVMMMQLLVGELVEAEEHHLEQQLRIRLHEGLNAKRIWNP